MKRMGRRMALGAAILAGVLGATGCDDDHDGSAATPNSPASAEKSAALDAGAGPGARVGKSRILRGQEKGVAGVSGAKVRSGSMAHPEIGARQSAGGGDRQAQQGQGRQISASRRRLLLSI